MDCRKILNAELRKRLAIRLPTTISGKREASRELPAAASKTLTFAIRSFLEHSHVELMLRLSLR